MDLEVLDWDSNVNNSSGLSYVEERTIKYKTYDKVSLERNVSVLEINELLRRYSFIYENTGIILGQLIYESNRNNLSISRRLSSNTNIFINERNVALERDTALFSFLEEFLLGDIPMEETSFYKIINEIKDNKDLFKYTKKQFVNEDVVDFNMRVVLEFASFFIEQQVGAYILKKNDDIYENVYDHFGFVKGISISDVKQKLKALRPYFDILFYKNKEYGMWDGKRRVWIDRRDEFRVDSTRVYYNDFNTCFCEHKHYVDNILGEYFENTFRLPEKAIQSIYCRYHDELPWDLEVKCEMEEPELNSMNDSRLIRPDNTNPCNFSFKIKEGDIFVYGKNFYHLCHNCGFIVKVDKSLLSDGIQTRIRGRCSRDKNLFRKMELISELQALDDKSLPYHKVLFKNKEKEN